MEEPYKICEYCGDKFYRPRLKNGKISSSWYTRRYCSRKCGMEARERDIFTPRQIAFVKEYYKKLGNTLCAKRMGMHRNTLLRRVKRYEILYGPIPYIEPQPIERKPIDMKRQYSEAWIECKWILDRWHNQIIKGSTDLMKIHKIMRQKQDVEDEEIISCLYRRESQGMINNILTGNYEKVS